MQVFLLSISTEDEEYMSFFFKEEDIEASLAEKLQELDCECPELDKSIGLNRNIKLLNKKLDVEIVVEEIEVEGLPSSEQMKNLEKEIKAVLLPKLQLVK